VWLIAARSRPDGDSAIGQELKIIGCVTGPAEPVVLDGKVVAVAANDANDTAVLKIVELSFADRIEASVDHEIPPGTVT
jgi:hypothetical protein